MDILAAVFLPLFGFAAGYAVRLFLDAADRRALKLRMARQTIAIKRLLKAIHSHGIAFDPTPLPPDAPDTFELLMSAIEEAIQSIKEPK